MNEFFTRPSVAYSLLQTLGKFVKNEDFDIFLEPSAGNGAFLHYMPINKRIGLDILPKLDEIKKMDFNDYIPEKDKKYITIGNPPFGIRSGEAVNFFNKAAEFSDVIAFIVPRTFKKIKLQNRLNLNFSLIYSEDLPTNPCCFMKKTSAKCSFQIWKKTDKLREIILLPVKHKDFEIKTHLIEEKKAKMPENVDFAIKAFGSNCGKISNIRPKMSPKMWYWIKSNIDVTELKRRFSQLDYTVSTYTARHGSLGKGELIKLYTDKFDNK